MKFNFRWRIKSLSVYLSNGGLSNTGLFFRPTRYYASKMTKLQIYLFIKNGTILKYPFKWWHAPAMYVLSSDTYQKISFHDTLQNKNWFLFMQGNNSRSRLIIFFTFCVFQSLHKNHNCNSWNKYFFARILENFCSNIFSRILFSRLRWRKSLFS